MQTWMDISFFIRLTASQTVSRSLLEGERLLVTMQYRTALSFLASRAPPRISSTDFIGYCAIPLSATADWLQNAQFSLQSPLLAFCSTCRFMPRPKWRSRTLKAAFITARISSSPDFNTASASPRETVPPESAFSLRHSHSIPIYKARIPADFTKK